MSRLPYQPRQDDEYNTFDPDLDLPASCSQSELVDTFLSARSDVKRVSGFAGSFGSVGGLLGLFL